MRFHIFLLRHFGKVSKIEGGAERGVMTLTPRIYNNIFFISYKIHNGLVCFISSKSDLMPRLRLWLLLETQFQKKMSLLAIASMYDCAFYLSQVVSQVSISPCKALGARRFSSTDPVEWRIFHETFPFRLVQTFCIIHPNISLRSKMGRDSVWRFPIPLRPLKRTWIQPSLLLSDRASMC